MEKLYEIWSEDRYDLLVLDTPPSRNALDFLEAPNRLLQFIEGRSLQVFLAPTGFAAKVAGRGTSVMFSILRRITGVDLLQDLSEFFGSFSGMVGGFRERATKVNELLADEHSSFLVICGPQSETISEAVVLPRQAAPSRSLPFGGAIVNKVHRAGGALSDDAAAELARRPRRRPGATRRRELRGLPLARRARPAEHRAARGGARDGRDHRGALPRPGRPRPRRALRGEYASYFTE